MLNTKEKRFIRYWEEQRKGGSRSYFLLYIIGGFFIVTLFIFVILLFFLQIQLEPYMLWLVPAVGLLVAALMTWYGWRNNEKKWRRIIRREVESGRQAMEEGNPQPDL